MSMEFMDDKEVGEADKMVGEGTNESLSQDDVETLRFAYRRQSLRADALAGVLRASLRLGFLDQNKLVSSADEAIDEILKASSLEDVNDRVAKLGFAPASSSEDETVFVETYTDALLWAQYSGGQS